MAAQRAHLLTGGHIPDLHFAGIVVLPSGGGEERAVRAEHNAPDNSAVPCQGEWLLLGFRVPEFRGPVFASRGEAPAVGAERHSRMILMGPEFPEFLAGPCVPD